MIRRLSLAVAFGCIGSGGLPSHGAAQATGPQLSADEREAHAMGLEMSFACSPRRHGQASGSASTIRRESDALAGTAVSFRSIEGTFIALEEYDDQLDGHCLVFGWWGDELQPGAHVIGQLAMSAMEEEEMSGEHSFFAWGAVRTTGENVMLVVRSGTLDIGSIDGGSVTGTFELSGFVVDGAERRDVTWAGSFNSVPGEA